MQSPVWEYDPKRRKVWIPSTLVCIIMFLIENPSNHQSGKGPLKANIYSLSVLIMFQPVPRHTKSCSAAIRASEGKMFPCLRLIYCGFSMDILLNTCRPRELDMYFGSIHSFSGCKQQAVPQLQTE